MLDGVVVPFRESSCLSCVGVSEAPFWGVALAGVEVDFRESSSLACSAGESGTIEGTAGIVPGDDRMEGCPGLPFKER